MTAEICAECRNYFTKAEDVHTGSFTVSGGALVPLSFLAEGQYFRIVGSTFNDGVYKYPAMGELRDEGFEGAIWAMHVPWDFEALCRDVKAWCESNTDGTAATYTSESFGGYSYTRATEANGAPLTWQSVFAKKLNRYRRMRVL